MTIPPGPSAPGPRARLTGYARRLADQARGLPPATVDAVLAIGCFLTVAVDGIASDRAEWWIFALAGLNALPLMWRRQYPFTVTAIVGVGTTWLALVDALGNIPAAQLVVTYTFAALCPPVHRLILVLASVLGISVSLLGAGDDPLAFAPVGITFVVAYALGTGARARRDRIAMLEERARRLAEQQAAAATRERERIAREMHDILAHSMSLVVVQAEAGPVAVRRDPDKAEQVFDTISATAREALAQLRRALGTLRADDRTHAPQPDLDALPSLVTAVARADLDATLEEHGTRPVVPPDFAAAAYRIVQESLTNTVTHAGAGQVRVRLDWRDGALHLTVRDDGRGRAAAAPVAGRADADGGDRAGGHGGARDRGTAGGHGLAGMRERAATLGGELTCGPGPDGTGFQVTARLPLPPTG